MALKYQALNGTVINKTITIQGPDITKAGSPTIATSLANGVTLIGFATGTGTDYAVATSGASSSKYYAEGSITFNNINAIGYGTRGGLRIIYKHNNSYASSVQIKGVAKWVLMDTVGALSEVTRTVNLTVSAGNWVYATTPSDNYMYVVSFTFEPTE